MDNFNKNFQNMYKRDVEETKMIEEIGNMSQIQVSSQAPVLSQTSFLRKEPALKAKNLPVLRETIAGVPQTSTLVCHKGTEIFETVRYCNIEKD